MDAMINRLETTRKRYLELDALLISDEVIQDGKLMAKYAKEQASLRQVKEAYDDLEQLNSHLTQAYELLKENDAELKAIDRKSVV